MVYWSSPISSCSCGAGPTLHQDTLLLRKDLGPLLLTGEAHQLFVAPGSAPDPGETRRGGPGHLSVSLDDYDDLFWGIEQGLNAI